MMDQSIIDFAVYEDSREFVGIASATLPDMNFITQSLSGAGIGGNIEAVIAGHVDAMTLTLNFTTINEDTLRLSEPRLHQLDLRVAQQYEDNVASELKVKGYKHIFKVIPKSDKAGGVAPASQANGSGEYAVRYWATFLDGEKIREIDPLNNICYINGVDYNEPIRKALGK